MAHIPTFFTRRKFIETILWQDLPTIPLYREKRPAVIAAGFDIDDVGFNNPIGTNFDYPERIYLPE